MRSLLPVLGDRSTFAALRARRVSAQEQVVRPHLIDTAAGPHLGLRSLLITGDSRVTRFHDALPALPVAYGLRPALCDRSGLAEVLGVRAAKPLLMGG